MRIERHLVRTGHVVDIAALVVVVEHDAHREAVLDDRDVDEPVTRDAVLAALGERIAAVKAGMEFGEVGLVGDVADSAAH